MHKAVGAAVWGCCGWPTVYGDAKSAGKNAHACTHIQRLQNTFGNYLTIQLNCFYFFIPGAKYFVPEIIKTSPRAEKCEINWYLVVDSIKIQYSFPLSLPISIRSIQVFFPSHSCDKFYLKFRLNYSLHLISIDSSFRR